MFKTLKHPLSLRQAIAALFAVAVLGLIGYVFVSGATSWWHQRQLQRSIPAALAGIRAQREALIAIIEMYHRQFGYYPPMYTPPGPERGVINPLYYELLGVCFDPSTSRFHISTTKDPLTQGELQKFFNARSFSNCCTYPALPINFLTNRPLTVSMMTPEAELFGVGLNYTEFTPQDFWEDYDFRAWRYRTNPAEHNPGKYDLWVEVGVGRQHFIVGNWPEVQ